MITGSGRLDGTITGNNSATGNVLSYSSTFNASGVNIAVPGTPAGPTEAVVGQTAGSASKNQVDADFLASFGFSQ